MYCHGQSSVLFEKLHFEIIETPFIKYLQSVENVGLER